MLLDFILTVMNGELDLGRRHREEGTVRRDHDFRAHLKRTVREQIVLFCVLKLARVDELLANRLLLAL